MRFRPLPVLSGLALLALLVLLMFGRWQWDKYVHESAAAEAPVLEVALRDYTLVQDGVQLLYGVAEGGPGWRVLAPVKLGELITFVDAAYIAGPQPPDWQGVEYPGALRFGAQLSGVAKPVKPVGPLAPANDPTARVWFSVDPAAMAAAAGLDGPVDTSRIIAIAYVGEDGRASPNPFAQARVDSTPPAQHLGYAITWWGLALVLVGVYFAYHASSGRLRFGGPRA